MPDLPVAVAQVALAWSHFLRCYRWVAYWRGLMPNNSFKPTPLRGAA